MISSISNGVYNLFLYLDRLEAKTAVNQGSENNGQDFQWSRRPSQINSQNGENLMANTEFAKDYRKSKMLYNIHEKKKFKYFKSSVEEIVEK